MGRFAPGILTVLITASLGAFVTVAGTPEPRPAPSDTLQNTIEPLFTAGLYDSALAILPAFLRRAEATGDSVLLGRVLVSRGRMLLSLGRTAEADHDIEGGIRIAEAMRDTVGLMPALNFKGFVHTTNGRYDDAMRCYLRRLELAQRKHSPVDEAWARTSIGYLLHIQNEQERAHQEYLRAYELFHESGKTRLEISPLIGLGRVASAQGDEVTAIRCYQRAWVAARDVGDRLNEMWATNNLGVLEEARGNLSLAAQYQEHAFEMARELKSPQAMVVPAVNLVDRAGELGDFASAEAILAETRTLCDEKGMTGYLGLMDFHLAELRMRQGRNDAAAALLRRLIRDPSLLEPQHRDLAVTYLADVLASQDSVAAAIDLLSGYMGRPDARPYAEALPAMYLLLGRLHLEANETTEASTFAVRALDVGERLDNRRVSIAAMLLESRCRRLAGQSRKAAEILYAALDSMEVTRRRITTPRWRETYGQQVVPAFVEAAPVLLDEPSSAPSCSRQEAFFNAIQRVKTRTLLDRVSQPRSREVADEKLTADVTTLREVQSVLRPGEMLLDFSVGVRNSFLMAVTGDSCDVLELPGPGSSLSDRIRLLNSILASGDPALRSQYPEERTSVILQALGRELLGGIAPAIAHANRLFVSPDGFIATVPFGLLMPGVGDDIMMAGRDVIEIPSASVLVRERTTDENRTSGVLPLVAIEPPDRDLTGARGEARDLTRRYKNARIVTGVGGIDEFETAVNECQILHVAAHAHVVDNSPWESGIRLVGVSGHVEPGTAERPDVRGALEEYAASDSLRLARAFQSDPYIHAWQIARLRLATQVAVLSACETAGGRVTTGEGTLGLTAAFLSAGVPVVVSSRWPIDDHVTRRIMRIFYENLARGDPVGTALRNAQLQLRRTREYSHPYFWAGFAVSGDGSRSVAIQERRTPWAPAALLALAVAAAAYLVSAAWRRRMPESVG